MKEKDMGDTGHDVSIYGVDNNLLSPTLEPTEGHTPQYSTDKKDLDFD